MGDSGVTGSYLTMMSDSLDKKINAMNKIEAQNRRQKEILSRLGPFDADAFEETVDEKGVLIDELDRLNEGFEALFAKVRDEVDGNRERYRLEILSMQEKIRTITALSSSIQADEMRNRKLAEKVFTDARKDMAAGKKSSKAALDYYRSMAGSVFTPPQYFDSKH